MILNIEMRVVSPIPLQMEKAFPQLQRGRLGTMPVLVDASGTYNDIIN